MKLHALAFSVLLGCASLSFSATAAAPQSTQHEAGIAWFKGDVDAAFAAAKAANKPLFLYWGASWCPPCNQVKATIFNRQNFIERTRSFVPVYVDGDSPSAQKIGARFKVSGYPTMILFRPDGSEVTRLPGEVDANRYLQVLTAGISSNHTVEDLLKLAHSTPDKLSANDWKLLSYYTWYANEQHLVAGKDIPATLLKLATVSTDADSALRLQWRGWLATEEKAREELPLSSADRAKTLKQLQDMRWVRENADLVSSAGELYALLGAKASAEEKQALQQAADKALRTLLDDASLSRADRISMLDGLRTLVKTDLGKDAALPPALQSLIKEKVKQIESSTSDSFERQSVVSAAAHTLFAAGLQQESDDLLKAELKRSHSPYYFMLSLAGNAKKRGDRAAAISWYEQAYQAAKGPATRLQWGAAYLNGLLELSPDDEARIEKVAASVLSEFSKMPDAFYDRNRAQIERTGRRLLAWNLDGKHAQSFARVQAQVDAICAKLPKNDAERATCKGILPAAKEQM
ncbi:thioredoxin fold domain-containing protein [Massilia sp. W12]|uniref:thioredoxin family protein n=1 Tax=Massilia sp. W12 TaxID=3126507 RepID=UPI0030CB39B5